MNLRPEGDAALELLESAEAWVQALAAAPPGDIEALYLELWRQLRGTPRERARRRRAAALRRAGIYHALLCSDESVAAHRRGRRRRAS